MTHISSVMPNISMIVAMAENHAIGNNNKLPWHLPADLKHFKTITTGHPILMGRKTYLSIGKPLPNRRNIILTHDLQFTAPGCDIVHTLDDAIKIARLENATQLIIIGGAEVYKQFLAQTQRLYLTIIHHTFIGDVFFPAFNWNEWQVIDREEHTADDKNNYAYTFLTLQRR